MIELRDLVWEDAERLFLWRREREVDRWMYHSAPTDYDLHLAWLNDVLGNPDKTGWIIEENGRPCGFLMLNGLSDSQQRAQWGWYIGEADARGRGAGRAAQALGLDRAFFDYGLQKVWSEVLADNEAALKAQGAVDEAVDWLAPRIDPRPPVLRLVPVEGFEILGEAHLRGDGHAHGPAASAIAMPASVSRVSTACCASTSARAAEVGLAGKGHGRVIEHKVNGCSPGM